MKVQRGSLTQHGGEIIFFFPNGYSLSRKTEIRSVFLLPSFWLDRGGNHQTHNFLAKLTRESVGNLDNPDVTLRLGSHPRNISHSARFPIKMLERRPGIFLEDDGKLMNFYAQTKLVIDNLKIKGLCAIFVFKVETH